MINHEFIETLLDKKEKTIETETKSGFDIPIFINQLLESNNIILAGGFLRKYYDKLPTEDIDLFCFSPEVFNEVKFQLEKIDTYKNIAFTQCNEQKLLSCNIYGLKIQLIWMSKFKYNPDESGVFNLINNFDIRAGALAYFNNKLISLEGAINDAENKIINIHKCNYPLGTMRRILKMKKRGYSITENSLRNFGLLLSREQISSMELYAID